MEHHLRSQHEERGGGAFRADDHSRRGLGRSEGARGANPFDTFYFAFQQPYTYKGGDLVILITHDGNNVASAIYQERMADSPTTYGVGQYASTYNATTATVPGNGPMVTRIHFGHTITVCTGSGGLPPLLILSHALVTPTPPPGTVNFAVTNALGGAMGFLDRGADPRLHSLAQHVLPARGALSTRSSRSTWVVPVRGTDDSI